MEYNFNASFTVVAFSKISPNTLFATNAQLYLNFVSSFHGTALFQRESMFFGRLSTANYTTYTLILRMQCFVHRSYTICHQVNHQN